MLTISDDMNSYLAFSHYIDGDEPSVQRKAKELKESTGSEIELVKTTYYFVRDEINHSWDAQDKRVTATASDVLREGVGICWAKANLLAAFIKNQWYSFWNMLSKTYIRRYARNWILHSCSKCHLFKIY